MGIWFSLNTIAPLSRNFLTPKPDPDPSSKNTGYGWGWLVLVGFFSRGILGIPHLPDFAIIFEEFVCLPEIVIIYFLIRKKFIEKRRYGNKISMASYMAGFWSLLLGILLLIVVSLFFLVITKTRT